MRILYVHRGYFPSIAGAETMARVIAERMQQRGHAVQLLMATHENTIQRTTYNGVAITAVPLLDAQALQEIQEWQPEILHSIDAVDPFFPRAALTRARAGKRPFMITPASAIETWQDSKATMAVCREAEAVFVLTNEEAERFRCDGVDARKLVITGQGSYLQGTPNPASFRRRYDIVGPLVLFLGRKLYFKGYQTLLEATRHVWTQLPDTIFMFMGPRWDADCVDLFRTFADPRIIELEVADEQEKYSALTACDVLCLPTTVDVFPLVFVEAWACGKPVITAPFPGAAEVVRDGKDGLIVEREPVALAKAIVTLLNDPGRRLVLGEAGRQRVRRELNWDVVADRILEGYHHALRLREELS